MGHVLMTQGRVIGALILRETRTTFGTAQLGYFWAIANPALGVAVLVAIFSVIGRLPPFGTSFALFFATGILPYELYRKLSSSLMGAFDANRGLMSYPLVKETDVLFARSLLIIATYVLVMVLFFGTLIVAGLAQFPAYLDEVFLAVAAASLLGVGAGTTNAVILSLFRTWKQIESVLSKPLFFISGIFYIPSAFPPDIIWMLSWNPVLHVVEWMREGYYSNYNSVVLDKPYLLGFAAALLLAGFGGERLYRKKRV